MTVAVITGSNSGFGLHGALAFARHGAVVYASMRDTSRGTELRRIASEESLDIRIRTLDVTKPASFASFIDEVVAEAGRIDVLVNNAGVLKPGALEDLSEATLRLVLETNLVAPLLLSKAVLPQMRKQQDGCIIMISSLSGLAGLPGDVAYTASKFGLEGATEALRHEVDRWGIKLALIEPGMYATGMFNTSKGGLLPDGYPADSPYRAFVEQRLRALQERLPEANDPAPVGALMVEIAQSDSKQFRWPADPLAEKVLATMLAQDDASRDAFLRDVGASDWWSNGEDAPSH
ncbi:MAG: SDR family oxidoreductase [Woeseiaceae bacterium]|nr:SDR family oxidoreductase [Woeseiaceae bacterium]